MEATRVAPTSDQYACRICGGGTFDRRIHVPTKSVVREYSTWLRCTGCASYQMLKLPSEQLLAAFYTEYDKGVEETVPHVGVNRGARYQPEYLETLKGEFRLTLTDLEVEHTLASLSISRPSVLDYGCQNGAFLDVARALVGAQETLGTDFDTPRARAIEASGHRFVPLHQLADSGRRFDLIALWDVFEHILDLDGAVRLFHRLSRPGALLALSTPMAGYLAEALGPAWEHFLPIQHLTLASRRGLAQFFTSRGYKLLKALSYGANAPPSIVPQPYKTAYDGLVKAADVGSTQVALFQLQA